MTEPKWTPGEWHAGRLNTAMVLDEEGRAIADCDYCREQDEANARLIAAAPALYAALQISREVIRIARGAVGAPLSDEMERAIGVIDAALRAARGETGEGR